MCMLKTSEHILEHFNIEFKRLYKNSLHWKPNTSYISKFQSVYFFSAEP